MCNGKTATQNPAAEKNTKTTEIAKSLEKPADYQNYHRSQAVKGETASKTKPSANKKTFQEVRCRFETGLLRFFRR